MGEEVRGVILQSLTVHPILTGAHDSPPAKPYASTIPSMFLSYISRDAAYWVRTSQL